MNLPILLVRPPTPHLNNAANIVDFLSVFVIKLDFQTNVEVRLLWLKVSILMFPHASVYLTPPERKADLIGLSPLAGSANAEAICRR